MRLNNDASGMALLAAQRIAVVFVAVFVVGGAVVVGVAVGVAVVFVFVVGSMVAVAISRAGEVGAMILPGWLTISTPEPSTCESNRYRLVSSVCGRQSTSYCNTRRNAWRFYASRTSGRMSSDSHIE